MTGLRIEAAGLGTTIQDLGRTGYQRFGIPVSGAIDQVCLRVANIVAGNAEGTPAVEVLYQALMLEVVADSMRAALAGTDASMEILRGSDKPERIPAFCSIRLERGERLRIVPGGTAAAYLAIEGGFEIEPFLGSCATFLRAG